MNRNEWEFEYTAAKLAEAAETKRDESSSKVGWWKAKKEEVMQEIRDSGIEITESMAAVYSNTSAGSGPQVMVRADLQTKLTESFNKIKEHDTASKEYEGWRQMLEANSEARLALTNDDWLYFFGA